MFPKKKDWTWVFCCIVGDNHHEKYGRHMENGHNDYQEYDGDDADNYDDDDCDDCQQSALWDNGCGRPVNIRLPARHLMAWWRDSTRASHLVMGHTYGTSMAQVCMSHVVMGHTLTPHHVHYVTHHLTLRCTHCKHPYPILQYPGYKHILASQNRNFSTIVSHNTKCIIHNCITYGALPVQILVILINPIMCILIL